MTCSCLNCQKPARWKPVIEVRSSAKGAGRRASLEQLAYCDKHRGSLTLAAFLSEEGFAKLERTVREAGKERLDPRLSTLAWAPLTHIDKLRLSRHQQHTVPPNPADLPIEDLATL